MPTTWTTTQFVIQRQLAADAWKKTHTFTELADARKVVEICRSHSHIAHGSRAPQYRIVREVIESETVG